MRRLRLLWLWWRTRKWTPEDHDMCLSFMGPCIGPGSCTERREYVRLKNPLPEARLLSTGYAPKARRVHTIFTCRMIGHCHECDEYPRPCCEECRYFGPCTECDANRKPRDCGDNRCGPCAVRYRGADVAI